MSNGDHKNVTFDPFCRHLTFLRLVVVNGVVNRNWRSSRLLDGWRKDNEPIKPERRPCVRRRAVIGCRRIGGGGDGGGGGGLKFKFNGTWRSYVSGSRLSVRRPGNGSPPCDANVTHAVPTQQRDLATGPALCARALRSLWPVNNVRHWQSIR